MPRTSPNFQHAAVCLKNPHFPSLEGSSVFENVSSLKIDKMRVSRWNIFFKKNSNKDKNLLNLVQTRKYTTRRERTHKGYRLQQHTFMKIVGCATYSKQSIRDVDLYGVWQPIH